jgi:hypothetical protein
MLYSLRILSDEGHYTKPLSTIGDAINSFLVREDVTTRNLGLMDKSNLSKRKADWPIQRTPLAWAPTNIRWYRLISMKRKVFTPLL